MEIVVYLHNDDYREIGLGDSLLLAHFIDLMNLFYCCDSDNVPVQDAIYKVIENVEDKKLREDLTKAFSLVHDEGAMFRQGVST